MTLEQLRDQAIRSLLPGASDLDCKIEGEYLDQLIALTLKIQERLDGKQPRS